MILDVGHHDVIQSYDEGSAPEHTRTDLRHLVTGPPS